MNIMKYPFLVYAIILILPCTGILVTGCKTNSSGTSTASPTSIGYQIANFLQQFNTGVSAAIPPVTAFLKQTHNSGDASTVNLYATLAAQFAGAVSAAIKANLPPQQVQAVASASIAPPAVDTAVVNVTASTPTP